MGETAAWSPSLLFAHILAYHETGRVYDCSLRQRGRRGEAYIFVRFIAAGGVGVIYGDCRASETLVRAYCSRGLYQNSILFT
jgi:hypothetical protein